MTLWLHCLGSSCFLSLLCTIQKQYVYVNYLTYFRPYRAPRVCIRVFFIYDYNFFKIDLWYLAFRLSVSELTHFHVVTAQMLSRCSTFQRSSYCSILIFIWSPSMFLVHLRLHLRSESWIEKTGYTEIMDTYNNQAWDFCVKRTRTCERVGLVTGMTLKMDVLAGTVVSSG